VGLVTNVAGFTEMTRVSESAAWMHVGLRTIGCGAAIYAIVKMRQLRRDDSPSPLLAVEPQWSDNPYRDGTPQAEEWETQNAPR
jgi:hypothetical protein